MKIEINGRVISKENNKRIFVKYGKVNVIPSKAFAVFREEVMWHLKGVSHFTGKMDADIDNMQTSLLDILEDAEIIDNDKNVVDLHDLSSEDLRILRPL